MLSRRPLQAWLERAERAAAARAAGRAAVGAGGGMNVKPWEIYFEELNLLEVIGEGSFGRVFLARWHEVDVAVKVLIAGGISDIAARLTLSHPLLASLQAVRARGAAAAAAAACEGAVGCRRALPCAPR